jgi:hypothetical protein
MQKFHNFSADYIRPYCGPKILGQLVFQNNQILETFHHEKQSYLTTEKHVQKKSYPTAWVIVPVFIEFTALGSLCNQAWFKMEAFSCYHLVQLKLNFYKLNEPQS